jgi:MFS family permease
VIEPNLGACNIGYVMAANYAASALVSISIGRVSDVLGRPFVMGFAGSCLCCMFVVLKYYPPTTALTIYGLAIVIGLGLAALRTPLSAQLSANYLDQTEAAFAASEMCSTVAAALGAHPPTQVQYLYLSVGIVLASNCCTN